MRSRTHLKQATDNGDHTNLPIHFRTARGRLIPFIKFQPNHSPTPIVGDGKRLPLVSVTCGPGGDRISAGMAIRTLLDGRAFPEVRVNHSEIPLVF